VGIKPTFASMAAPYLHKNTTVVFRNILEFKPLGFLLHLFYRLDAPSVTQPTASKQFHK